jgi:hypothetical protein
MTCAAFILALTLLAVPAWAQQSSNGLPLNILGKCDASDNWCISGFDRNVYIGPHPSDDYILVLKCHAGGICQPYAPCRADGKTWLPDATGQCNASDEPR